MIIAWTVVGKPEGGQPGRFKGIEVMRENEGEISIRSRLEQNQPRIRMTNGQLPFGSPSTSFRALDLGFEIGGTREQIRQLGNSWLNSRIREQIQMAGLAMHVV